MSAINGAHKRACECISESEMRRIITRKASLEEQGVLMDEINTCVFCKRKYIQQEEALRPKKLCRQIGS